MLINQFLIRIIMVHQYSQEAEEIIDKKFPVLDHGFIRLVSYMGTDQRIVDAARVSYGGQGKEKSLEEDKRLIRRLMRDKHTSPFEMVTILYHVKLPIFVARQWIRHRTASVNEISARYTQLEDEFYLPGEFRMQDPNNKQGSIVTEVSPDLKQEFLNLIISSNEESYNSYHRLLDLGLARDMARIPLGLGIYTEWYWQINLHNNFNFLRLRITPDAQWEIRQYANVMGNEIVRRIAPMAYEAFEDYVLNSLTFSRMELNALRVLMMTRNNLTLKQLKEVYGLAKAERESFPLKLERIGLEGRVMK